MPERYVTPLPDFIFKKPSSPTEDSPDPEDPKKPYVASWRAIFLKLIEHPRMLANVPALRSHNLLKRKLDAAQVGVTFSVPEEDWARLAGVLNDPDAGLQKVPEIGTLPALTGIVNVGLPQLEDFFTSWTDAPTKPPAEPAATDPAPSKP